MDAVSAHQAGFQNVVASGGTALTIDQLTVLKKLTTDIAFCFDSDFAGSEAAMRAIELADTLSLNLKVILLPKPFKDVDECVKENPELFRKAIEDSVSIYDFYFLTALTRNNPFDPIGKKKIADFLVPIIAKMKNPVLRDHYVKRLAKELYVSEGSVADMLNSYTAPVGTRSQVPRTAFTAVLQGESLQEYLLQLILKSPLDMAQTNLYKLGQRDFTDPELEDIFVELKSHLLGRKKKFDIALFSAKLDDKKAQRVSALYLKDTGDLNAFETDTDRLRDELNTTLKRVKAETVKRELKILSLKIRQAEASQDVEEIKRLSEEFRNVSERLV